VLSVAADHRQRRRCGACPTAHLYNCQCPNAPVGGPHAGQESWPSSWRGPGKFARHSGPHGASRPRTWEAGQRPAAEAVPTGYRKVAVLRTCHRCAGRPRACRRGAAAGTSGPGLRSPARRGFNTLQQAVHPANYAPQPDVPSSTWLHDQAPIASMPSTAVKGAKGSR